MANRLARARIQLPGAPARAVMTRSGRWAMPRELVAVAPRTPVLREYADEPLGAGEIRVRTRYGSPKHGTELHLYRGDQFADGLHWDDAERLVLPGPPARPDFPLALGNIAVGTVA